MIAVNILNAKDGIAFMNIFGCRDDFTSDVHFARESPKRIPSFDAKDVFFTNLFTKHDFDRFLGLIRQDSINDAATEMQSRYTNCTSPQCLSPSGRPSGLLPFQATLPSCGEGREVFQSKH